jgi:hypothetical protein
METVQTQLAANVPFRFFKVRAPISDAHRAFREESVCRRHVATAAAAAAAAAAHAALVPALARA